MQELLNTMAYFRQQLQELGYKNVSVMISHGEFNLLGLDITLSGEYKGKDWKFNKVFPKYFVNEVDESRDSQQLWGVIFKDWFRIIKKDHEEKVLKEVSNELPTKP